MENERIKNVLTQDIFLKHELFMENSGALPGIITLLSCDV
jgi:hypothetical protein